MKLLIITIFTMMVTAIVALWAMQDPGYLLISLGAWTLETTVSFAIIAIGVAFLAFYYSLRTISGLRNMVYNLRHWRTQKQEQNAQRALTRGLIELAEGRWKSAEKHLLRSTSKGPTSLLNYLSAARAAQAQGADERRDHYIKLAYESHSSADIAVGLTQADLLLKQNQQEQALATLRHLYQIAPKHPQILKTLALLYRDLRDWEHLLELVPLLQKYKVMTDPEITELSQQAYSALLGKTDGHAVAIVWNKIPRKLQEDPVVLKAYVERLLTQGDAASAEPLLRLAIRRRLNEPLLHLYGLVKTSEPGKQLSFVESLLREDAHNPGLLLAAGRLCLRNKLWGKARSYLEASISSRPNPEAYHELGNLLEHLGESAAAAECYRAGLSLTSGCEQSVPYSVASLSISQELLNNGKRYQPTLSGKKK